MTVIQPNSISGITSITAQGDTISLFKSDGTTVGALNVNVNASSGITTIANLSGTNINATGVTTSATLTVTGVGTFGTSVGILTSSPRTTVQIGSATTQSVFITSAGFVGLGSTNPAVSLDASRETDAFALPQGTTAQRPSGNNPYIRWNTSNNALEIYNGTDWVEIITDYFPSGSVILG
jgi:hypothetical protein